jgi:hypothetical protein
MPRKLVISFPKSGRSWLRYALELTEQAEDITFSHDEFEYNDGLKPSLNFDINRRYQRYNVASDKILYIERDARDTIVSLYNQITGRFADFFNYKGDISAFIRDEYFGVDNLLKFQKLWQRYATENSLPIIRYEHMHSDYEAVLLKVCNFFDINVSAQKIERISEMASFDNMKQFELSGQSQRPWLSPRNSHCKVRKGKVGGYSFELNEADIAYIESRMKYFNM